MQPLNRDANVLLLWPTKVWYMQRTTTTKTTTTTLQQLQFLNSSLSTCKIRKMERIRKKPAAYLSFSNHGRIQRLGYKNIISIIIHHRWRSSNSPTFFQTLLWGQLVVNCLHLSCNYMSQEKNSKRVIIRDNFKW